MANPGTRPTWSATECCNTMPERSSSDLLTPSFIAWEALRDGKLVALLQDYPQPEISAWAVYPRTRYLSMRARAFIDFLVERFGEQPYWDCWRPAV